MREKILIVDDVATNRDILSVMLGEIYPDIIEANDGENAIEMVEKYVNDISVILLDLIMPKKSGYEVLEYMIQKNLLEKIPVLIISGESSLEAERKCLNLGVADFIRKPFDKVSVQKRVKNTADLYRYKSELEKKVVSQNAALNKQNKLLNEQAVKLRENNEKILDLLGNVVEYRNLESGEHIKRVKKLTRILAEEMAKNYKEYGLDSHKVDIIVAASAMHDIGKIAIKDSVLLKPGRLTDDEFEYMKSHTTKGCDILQNVENAWDKEYGLASYEICRHHHERFDGRGYPDGLMGDDIPISAQIVSIADVYDALVSERVYKEAYDSETAFRMIMNGECGVFSPKLMVCFRKVKDKLNIA